MLSHVQKQKTLDSPHSVHAASCQNFTVSFWQHAATLSHCHVDFSATRGVLSNVQICCSCTMFFSDRDVSFVKWLHICSRWVLRCSLLPIMECQFVPSRTRVNVCGRSRAGPALVPRADKMQTTSCQIVRLWFCKPCKLEL